MGEQSSKVDPTKRLKSSPLMIRTLPVRGSDNRQARLRCGERETAASLPDRHSRKTRRSDGSRLRPERKPRQSTHASADGRRIVQRRDPRFQQSLIRYGTLPPSSGWNDRYLLSTSPPAVSRPNASQSQRSDERTAAFPVTAPARARNAHSP